MTRFFCVKPCVQGQIMANKFKIIHKCKNCIYYTLILYIYTILYYSGTKKSKLYETLIYKI